MDGSFWIGGDGLGERSADGKFRRYHKLDGLAVAHLVEDNDGAIWAGGTPQSGGSPLCRIYRGKSVTTSGGARHKGSIRDLHRFQILT
jgi:hypothetical protein